MSNERQAQSELLYLLGQLLGPLESLSYDFADPADRRRALARYSADLPTFLEHFRSFTHPLGHAYQAEFRTGLTELSSLSKRGATCLNDLALFRETVASKAALLRDLICSIPVAGESEILQAHTPFSAYCFIRDLCTTASQRIVWVDRYFSSAVFYRYLRNISPSTTATLVTWPEAKYAKADWADFLEASRLFATERGPDKYVLLVKPDFHDRWLSCDERLYLLGGSGKDAGQTSDFTVSAMQPTAETLARFAAATTGAAEFFGRSHPKHP